MMRDLLEGNSSFGGALGEELNRLREAIRALVPTDNDLLQADRTTRGTTWRPTSRLLHSLSAAAPIEAFTIASTAPQSVTAISGTVITKPVGPRSYSDLGNETGDTTNWRPAHGVGTSLDHHYNSEHYRHAIIHSGATLLGGAEAGSVIDYHVQLQKLEPFYLQLDVIYAVLVDGTWIDLNVAGRHWRNVHLISTDDPSRNATGSDFYDANETFVFGTQQLADQVYSNNNPTWLTPSSFPGADLY